MAISNAKLNQMTYAQKLEYYCGGRVTVGTIRQVFDKKIKKSYVAKIRSTIVGTAEKYRHETEEEAREYGREFLADWKKKLAELQADQS